MERGGRQSGVLRVAEWSAAEGRMECCVWQSVARPVSEWSAASGRVERDVWLSGVHFFYSVNI